MFKPASMVRVDCIVASNVRSRLSHALQRGGVTEVEFLPNEFLEEKNVERSRPDEEVTQFSELVLKADKLIGFFAEYDVRKTSLVEDVLGIERVEPAERRRLSSGKLLDDSARFLSGVEGSVEGLSERNARVKRRLEELSSEVEVLCLFDGLNPKVEWLGESDYVYAQAAVATTQGFDELRKELSGGFGLESAITADGRVAFIVYAAKAEKEVLDKVLRKTNCERKTLKGVGRVRDLLAKARDEVDFNAAERKRLSEKTRNLFNVNYRRLLEVRELLLIEKKRCEVYVRCGKTERAEVMRLWTPAKKKRKVLALIEEETEGLCSIEVEENLTDAPILLENPPVIRSFEMLTKLFSPPKYREVDPTPFIAPTFALFFGLMLTDAVYGTVLALAAWQIAERYGRYSKSLKDVCVILMACGVSAVFWGILTGSILGDFLGKYVLGGVGSQTVAVWLDPMYGKNAVTFLALVVTIGLAHLFTGYAIGLYYALKDGRTRDALLTYGSWFILAGGVAIIILAGSGKLPENTRYAGYLISAVGVALSLMRSSFMALMEITGLVGNALSYARLLALALTTSGIAMTFNFLASNAVKVPYVGFLLAALVFIFGHVMNILINTLGGFVHSLRLHYLEFFGTFYQGGGREFTPFTEERKYTKTR